MSQLWGGNGEASGDGVSLSGNSIVYVALRRLTVLRSAGQGASAETIADGLSSLNEFVDTLNADGYALHRIQRDVFDMDAGRTVHGLGPGSASRPAHIKQAGLLLSGSTTEIPVEIEDDKQRVLRSGGRRIHCDYAHPMAAITLSWSPSSGDRLVLYSWAPLLGFPNGEQPESFPPGYAAALTWGLADYIAPEMATQYKFPQPLLDKIERNARKFLAKIKHLNRTHRRSRLTTDTALQPRGGFDINTGGF